MKITIQVTNGSLRYNITPGAKRYVEVPDEDNDAIAKAVTAALNTGWANGQFPLTAGDTIKITRCRPY